MDLRLIVTAILLHNLHISHVAIYVRCNMCLQIVSLILIQVKKCGLQHCRQHGAPPSNTRNCRNDGSVDIYIILLTAPFATILRDKA